MIIHPTGLSLSLSPFTQTDITNEVDLFSICGTPLTRAHGAPSRQRRRRTARCFSRMKQQQQDSDYANIRTQTATRTGRFFLFREVRTPRKEGESARAHSRRVTAFSFVFFSRTLFSVGRSVVYTKREQVNHKQSRSSSTPLRERLCTARSFFRSFKKKTFSSLLRCNAPLALPSSFKIHVEHSQRLV